MLADTANPQCQFFGKYGTNREITGLVTRDVRDDQDYRHIIVQDQGTGCRVFVLTEDKSCAVGKQFKAFGRLRSYSRDDHDVMFDSPLNKRPCD